MKKIISLLLTVLLLLSVTGTVYAAETELTTDSAWKISVSSEMWGSAGRAFDGDPETFWHSAYTVENDEVTAHDSCPFYITVDFGKTMKISGWKYTPRKGNGAGIVTKYNIYASADGETFKQIYSGTFDYLPGTDDNRPVGKASWGDVEMKAVKIEYVEAINGFGTAAEINFYTGGSGKTNGSGEALAQKSESGTESGDEDKLDKTGWSITSTSAWEWGQAEKMIDGDTQTYWHSHYVGENGVVESYDEPPYTIEITLPKAEKATGLLYTPRQDNNVGRWKEAEIYVSADGKDKGEKAADFEADSSKTDAVAVAFKSELTVKKLTIVVTKGAANYGSCAEIDLLTGEIKQAEPEKFEDFEDSFNTAGWKIKVNSEVEWSPIGKAFDGNKSTIWHSYYENEGSTITKQDTAPYTIDITMPEKKRISGFTVYNRESVTGRAQAYELYAAETEDSELVLISKGSLDATNEDDVSYGIAFEAAKLRFVITDSNNNYGVMAELVFKKATDEETYSPEEFAAAYEKIRPREINKNNFRVECSEEKVWGSAKLSNIFDGTSSAWQTDELAFGTPVTLTVELGGEYEINAMSYLPRQTNDYHGYWLEFNVWAGTSKDNLEEVLTQYSFPDMSLGEKTINFEKPIKARYVEIEITKYYSERVSCGELTFWQSNDGTDGKSKYVMKIGSNELEITKGGESFTKTLDTAPYITSAGRTLIPLRGLLEEMGAEITWNDEDQSIRIGCDGASLLLQINYPIVWSETVRLGKIMYTLESAPGIKDSRTFVPLRFLSEQFGYEVGWDGETQTVTIEK